MHFDQLVERQGVNYSVRAKDKASQYRCDLYNTRTRFVARQKFIPEEDGAAVRMYIYVHTGGVGHGRGRGPRSFVAKVKVIRLLELVRRRKMDEYENFPVSVHRLVDTDRAKNRRPQCASIFVRPPSLSFACVHHDVESLST